MGPKRASGIVKPMTAQTVRTSTAVPSFLSLDDPEKVLRDARRAARAAKAARITQPFTQPSVTFQALPKVAPIALPLKTATKKITKTKTSPKKAAAKKLVRAGADPTPAVEQLEASLPLEAATNEHRAHIEKQAPEDDHESDAPPPDLSSNVFNAAFETQPSSCSDSERCQQQKSEQQDACDAQLQGTLVAALKQKAPPCTSESIQCHLEAPKGVQQAECHQPPQQDAPSPNQQEKTGQQAGPSEQPHQDVPISGANTVDIVPAILGKRPREPDSDDDHNQDNAKRQRMNEYNSNETPCAELARLLAEYALSYTHVPRAGDDDPVSHGNYLFLSDVIRAITSVSEQIKKPDGTRQFAVTDDVVLTFGGTGGVNRVVGARLEALIPWTYPYDSVNGRQGHTSLFIVLPAANGNDVLNRDSHNGGHSHEWVFQQLARDIRERIADAKWHGVNPVGTETAPVRMLTGQQLASWTCGMHTIFNAWAYALGLEISATPVARYDEFIRAGEGIIRMAVRGHLSSRLIWALFDCFGFTTSGQTITEGRRFQSTLPIRNRHALCRYVAIQRISEDLDIMRGLGTMPADFPDVETALMLVEDPRTLMPESPTNVDGAKLVGAFFAQQVPDAFGTQQTTTTNALQANPAQPSLQAPEQAPAAPKNDLTPAVDASSSVQAPGVTVTNTTNTGPVENMNRHAGRQAQAHLVNAQRFANAISPATTTNKVDQITAQATDAITAPGFRPVVYPTLPSLATYLTDLDIPQVGPEDNGADGDDEADLESLFGASPPRVEDHRDNDAPAVGGNAPANGGAPAKQGVSTPVAMPPATQSKRSTISGLRERLLSADGGLQSQTQSNDAAYDGDEDESDVEVVTSAPSVLSLEQVVARAARREERPHEVFYEDEELDYGDDDLYGS